MLLLHWGERLLFIYLLSLSIFRCISSPSQVYHRANICMKLICTCWWTAAHIGLRVSSISLICEETGYYCSLYLFIQDGEVEKEEKEGARWESLECMHYVSYPTVKKTSTMSGNGSGQRCTEVNAANANEGSAFAGGYIWLKAQVMANTAQWCYQRKHTESKRRPCWREMSFWGLFLAQLEIKDLITDILFKKRAKSLMQRN